MRTESHPLTVVSETGALALASATPVSDVDFVRQLYKNVLGRSEVDPAGFAYWLDALAQPEGSPDAQSRESLAHTLVYSPLAAQSAGSWTIAGDPAEIKHAGALSIESGMDFSSPLTQVSRDGVIVASSGGGEMSTALTLVGFNDPGFALI